MSSRRGAAKLSGVVWAERRVAELEAELAESLSTQNKESSELHCQILKLLSQLEGGEVERQNLEATLLLFKQQSQQALTAKEKEWAGLIASYQDHLSSLSEQCWTWRHTLEAVQKVRANEKAESEALLDGKEKELVSKCTELCQAEEFKDQLQFDLTSARSEVCELKEQLECVESSLREKEEAYGEVTQALTTAQNRENDLEQQLRNALLKCDSLESSLTKERMLLQTLQFNFDLAEEQVKDQATRLECEHVQRGEWEVKVRELERAVMMLKGSVEAEANKNTTLREQLQARTSEHHSLVKQCSEKQATISDLSHQLHLLQASAASLKEGQNVAEQKLCVLEEVHNTCLREANTLITNFQNRLLNKEEEANEGSASCKSPSFLEHLRLCLVSFQTAHEAVREDLSSSKSELATAQQTIKLLTSEGTTYKESLAEKSVALAEAEKKLQVSIDELKWYKAQALNIEKKFLILEKEIVNHCKRNEIEGSDQTRVTKELVSQEKRLTSENNSHWTFIFELLEMVSSKEHCQNLVSKLESTPESFSWIELAGLVKMSVQALKTAHRKALEEVSVCKHVIENQNSLLESAAQKHEELLSQHEVADLDKEKQWEKRLTDIKHNYEALLMGRDNGSRVIETQIHDSVCELEKSRKALIDLEHANKSLKMQLVQLSDAQKLLKNDRACLLSCVCLMTGNIMACLYREKQLQFQKQLLLSKPTILHPKVEHFKCCFKTVSVLVLAAVRLRRLRSESARLQLHDYPENLSIIPFIGFKPPSPLCHRDISQWLRSEQVLLDVRQCFTGLQKTLDFHTSQQHRSQNSERRGSCGERTPRGHIENFLEKDKFKTEVMNCHSNFHCKLQTYFQFTT